MAWVWRGVQKEEPVKSIEILAAGVFVMTSSTGLFVYCLPRGGKVYRFADTPWEPYVGVAFCAGFALGFSMILSSILDLLS
jgi:hypothetical protein